MALYGESRDISLFRSLNRELLHNITSQQCVYYKLDIVKTKTNIYGEADEQRYYKEPVILFAQIERSDQEYPTGEDGVDFNWGIDFKFFRDDLVDANIVCEVGDIIMYYEGYYEVHSTIGNQYFVGKHPDYPYNENPLNPGLENFGSSISIICKTHYTPADRVQITKERL